MALIDLREAVDEAAAKLPPVLDPILAKAIDKLIDDLKGVLIGREITFTIVIK